MKKFVLDQAGELSEFRNVSAQKIHFMHQTQRATDLPFLRTDLLENFAWRLGILIRSGHLLQVPSEQVFQLRAKIEMIFLRELKRSHHLDRLGLKKIFPVGMKLSVANKKRTQFCFRAAPQRQETEKCASATRCVAARELLGDAFGHPKNISRMLVIIAH